MVSMFKLSNPSTSDIETFHRDGYIAYPDVMCDDYREALIKEVLSADLILDFLSLSNQDRAKLDNSTRYFVRPWDDRGPLSDALIDAPLVTALLQATVGPEYHFCHSSMNLALRGSETVRFHQDHHHWNHENPINLVEREKDYIQILYYPNGFTRGDRSLIAIPGSHLVSPTKDVTPDRLLAGDFDEEAGRKLEAVHLELPPGSFVYLNARMFHGVDPKLPDSRQPFRMFLIDIFKQAGPPHRYTQEIPDEWIQKASPERLKLFSRDPWTETCWNQTP